MSVADNCAKNVCANFYNALATENLQEKYHYDGNGSIYIIYINWFVMMMMMIGYMNFIFFMTCVQAITIRDE